MNHARSGIKIVRGLKHIIKGGSCAQNSRRLPALLQVNLDKRPSFVPDTQCRRNLHTTSALNELPFGIPSPSLVVKKMLLKTLVYPGFDQEDFLVGARGAICHVSNKLSRGELEELRQLLTEEAWENISQLYESHPYPEMFFIDSDSNFNHRNIKKTYHQQAITTK